MMTNEARGIGPQRTGSPARATLRGTARVAVLALFAGGLLQCGGAPEPPEPPDEVSAAAGALSTEADDLDVDRTVRCGQSLNVYVGTSETAEAYSQSAAKRICRQKLVNKMIKRTSCDRGACGGGSCRPSTDVRGTTYDCAPSGSDWRCRCRPTTVLYRCTSCSG